LWEKYRKLTPYHYCGNNPINAVDPSGLDSVQRSQAIEKATDYLESGSTYKMGAKGQPGQPVDCSGLVSNCVRSGGEPDPNKGNKPSGVLNIESNTQKVEPENVEAGNIVTFRTSGSWPYHTGIVVSVDKDNQGNVTHVSVIHSSSSKNGPTFAKLSLSASNGLGSKIYGFYKWDTKPDTKSNTKP
jgi:hypothetical protein